MKLRTKLILPLLFLLSLAIVFIQGYFLPQLSKSLERDFKEGQLSIIETLGTALIPSLLTDDLAELHALLDAKHLREPHWIYLAVHDENDHRIYPLSKNVSESSPHLHELSHQIIYREKALGNIVVIADSSEGVYEKERAIRNFVYFMMMGYLLVIAVVAWIQTRLVSRPIVNLAQLAGSVAKGDFQDILPKVSKDEIGKLTTSFLKMREDISAYQKELKNEALRIHTIMENVFNAIVTADENGNILSCNRAAVEMFGYSRKEMIGHSLSILMSDVDADIHDSYMHRYMQTGYGNVIGIGRQTTGKHKNGRLFPLELAVTEAEIDGKVIFTGVLQDITERKEAEEGLALRQMQITTINHAQRQFISDSSPSNLFHLMLPDVLALTMCQYGLIAEVQFDEHNEYYLNIYAESLLPQEMSSYSSSLISEDQTISQIVREVITSGETVCLNDIPDTSPMHHSSALDSLTGPFLGIPIFYGDKLKGVICLANRQSDFDQTATDLLQPIASTCAHLMDAIEKERERRAKEVQLEEAWKQSESATKAKSDFLATMSHEIRTPMNGVLGMLHLLQNTRLTEKQSRYLNTAVGSTNMLLTVINDILDFSKIEADKLELEAIPFKLLPLLEETITLFSKSVRERGLELIYNIGNNTPTIIKGDPTRLRQILTNLINNAIKFTEKGCITVSVEQTKDGLRFAVIDTGIGISEEQQIRLFKPFSQADSSHTRKYGGTGLGLAICKRLVNLMAGDLHVESVENFGTEFSFEIRPETIDLGVDNKLENTSFTNLSILVVADAYPIQINLRDMLNSMHIKKVDTTDSTTALSKIEGATRAHQPYNMILLDEQTKGIHWRALSKEIYKKAELWQAKLVLLSARDYDDLPPEISTCIVKPVLQSNLLDTLLSIQGNEASTHKHDDVGNEHERFRGKQILLVEDNLVNQEVAYELLSDAGFNVEIRDNGADAVSEVQQRDYDIVLMDIQMPVLDGISATKRIRQLGGKFADLPIIAMTAHALTGDCETSLEAGMNAHVLKPIEPKLLFQTISTWLTPKKQPNASESLDSCGTLSAKPEKFPDLPGIDVDDGLNRINGKWPAYRRILIGFKNTHANCAEALGSHIAQREWQQATTLIHTLKGSSGNIGAKALYDAAARFERFCIEQNTPACKTQLQEVCMELHQVLSGLSQLSSEDLEIPGDDEIPDELTVAELHDSLDRLLMLVDIDFGEARLYGEQLARRSLNCEWLGSIKHLMTMLNQLNMDSVCAIANDIRQRFTINENQIKFGQVRRQQ